MFKKSRTPEIAAPAGHSRPRNRPRDDVLTAHAQWQEFCAEPSRALLPRQFPAVVGRGIEAIAQPGPASHVAVGSAPPSPFELDRHVDRELA